MSTELSSAASILAASVLVQLILDLMIVMDVIDNFILYSYPFPIGPQHLFLGIYAYVLVTSCRYNTSLHAVTNCMPYFFDLPLDRFFLIDYFFFINTWSYRS